MQPDMSNLLSKAGITLPVIGIYDAPDPAAFAPVVSPEPGKHICFFAYFQQWVKGKTLHLTADNHGCGGCGRVFFNRMPRTREDFIKFLVDDEGLKASHELMGQWLDHQHTYRAENPHIMVGPLKAALYPYLKTATFWVNPDQLGLIMLGAQYYSAPTDPPPVLAPFGSGCMEMLPLFDNLDIPQAIIGSTDIAMRQYLPADILAFTVTKPMLERLGGLGEKSFLYKPFWKTLQKARGIS